MEGYWPEIIHHVAKLTLLAIQFMFIELLVYLNVSVYREVRRNEKQIITNQVSLEVNEKLFKNKIAFYSLHSYCTVHNFPALF